jgi:hypothetical protein
MERGVYYKLETAVLYSHCPRYLKLLFYIPIGHTDRPLKIYEFYSPSEFKETYITYTTTSVLLFEYYKLTGRSKPNCTLYFSIL